MANLKYPLKLNPSIHPMISFEPIDFLTKTSPIAGSGGRSGNYINKIFLYCPPGITFSDTASYSEFSLGILKDAATKFMKDTASDIIDSANKADGVFSTIGAVGGAAVADIQASVMQTMDNIGTAANRLGNDSSLASFYAASKYAKHIGNQELADAIEFNTAKVVNPRSNMAFKGIGIRSFSFNFRLVAESQAEANEIREIDKTFRYNLYPDVADEWGYILNFPYAWRLKLLWKGSSNIKLPSFWETCWLSSYQSTYNASTNLYHYDGAPIDVDFSLSFTESKALTKKDMQDQGLL